MPAERVLSYGSVIVEKTDLDTLAPACWLNDRIMTFASEFLLNELPKCKRSEIAIVDAPSVEIIKYCADAHAILASQTLFLKRMVIFILNDSVDPDTACSGTHWSILVYCADSKTAHLFDSINNYRNVVSAEVFRKARRLLGASGHVKLQREPMPQQYNNYDCGIYALEVIRRLLDEGVHGVSTLLLQPASYFTSKREYWREVILRLAVEQMLTPVFSIEQTDDHLVFVIHAPYANIAETEIEYAEELFVFSSRPYFLRVHLPAHVLDDESGWTKYDTDAGTFTVGVPKMRKGEHFRGLDMISELLRPQKAKPSARPMVEEVASTSDDDEDEGEEYLLDQVPMSIEDRPTDGVAFGYGFGWRKSGVLATLQADIGNVVELPDPEGTPISERIRLCYDDDVKSFDADRYLCDNLDPDDMLQHVLAQPMHASFALTTQSRHRLKDLPNRSIPRLSREEQIALDYLLVDVCFAFCYDLRVTDGEHSVESGWTIVRLSPSLSWLARFDSMRQAVIASFARVLTRPLYRNFALAQLVLQDVKHLFKAGRPAVVNALCEIHRIMIASGDFRYLFNDLINTDLLLWVQAIGDEVISSIASQLDSITVAKADLVEFELEELETTAKLQMMDVDAESLDSDDVED